MGSNASRAIQIDRADLTRVVCAAVGFNIGMRPRPDRDPKVTADLWEACQRLGALVGLTIDPLPQLREERFMANSEEVVNQLERVAFGVQGLEDELKDKGIHVGLGDPPKCVTCEEPWPCKESKA